MIYFFLLGRGGVLGDEGDELVEGNVGLALDVVGHQHFLYFELGGFVSETAHGLLPLLVIVRRYFEGDGAVAVGVELCEELV